MELVIDANVLFAAIIKKSTTSEIVVDEKLVLYAPEFIFSEFRKYKELIKRKTERSDQEFSRFIEILERKIKIIPSEEFFENIEEAKSISPDIKDMLYLALA